MNRATETALSPELQQQIAVMWRRRLSAFKPEALAWLLLPPGWTVELALACGFPDVSDFINNAEGAGLCQRQNGEFWLSKAVTDEVLAFLQQRLGVAGLLEIAREIGGRIRAVKESPTIEIPPPLARWSELAVRLDPKGTVEAADWFDAEVLALISEGRTGEALSWIETGASLAEVFTELQTAVRLGNRRLELVYRRTQDERHVRNYLPRQEQIDAFETLLTGRGGAWGLHYVGMGGVGKTMLLRYITARLATERNLATSRIDFDYISPDFPLRKPGQLLVELAAELRLYGTDESLLQQFDNSVKRLHEALSTGSSADPLQDMQIHAPLFERMARNFARLLDSLPRPVILILDTCEELAKFQPVGARLPNVEATFAILEMVHQFNPDVRVIFAGRRLLAQAGFDWQADTAYGAGKQHILPEKKAYLLLHEIRGFDEAEVALFLGEIKKLPVERDIYQTILEHSLETGSAVRLVGAPPDDRPRYNPFDVALFADWLQEEPGLTRDAIRAGKQDPYIDLRIRARLNPELRSLLPAVALLGRFDEAIFRLLVPNLDEDAFRDLYRELGDQEWIDYQRDEALETTFLAVDPNLLPRLRNYYEGDNRHRQLEAAKETLGPGLADLVRGRPLRQLNADYIDAALRFLPVEAAAWLWSEIELRIPLEADWNWARRVTERILAGEGAVSSSEHPLWAAVQATLAASMIHQPGARDLLPIWTAVAEAAPDHPVPVIAEWLQLRAGLGQLASGSLPDRLTDPEGWAGPMFRWQRVARPATLSWSSPPPAGWHEWHLSAQLAAALCAALDRQLDAAERAGTLSRPRTPANPVAWARQLAEAEYPPELTAFAYMLAGRSLLLWRESEEAVEEGKWLLREAITLLGDGHRVNTEQWADWRPPARLEARLRLQHLLLDPPIPDDERWGLVMYSVQQGYDATHLEEIDGERLVARALDIRLAHGPVALEELRPLQSSLRYRVERQPTCLAHEQVPPLVVVLARGVAGLGYATEGLEILNEHRELATRTGLDDRTVQDTQLATLGIVRRMRLRRSQSLLTESIRATDPALVAEAWPAAVLTDTVPPGALPQPPADAPLVVIHAWQRSQLTSANLIPVSLPNRHPNELSFEAVSVWLDGKEGNGADAEVRPGDFDPFVWWRGRPDRREEGLRLAVRWAALLGSQPDGRLVTQVPPRRRAEIALDEGELLALRRPVAASRLLGWAEDWFARANDPAGAFISALLKAVSARQDSGTVSVELTSLKSRYDTLLASLANVQLPSSLELIEQAQSRPASSGDVNWGGWLERMAAYLIIAIDVEMGPGLKGATLFRDKSPVDLQTLVTTIDTVAQPEVPSSPQDGALTKTGSFFYIIVGLAIILGVLSAGFYLFTAAWYRLHDVVAPTGEVYHNTWLRVLFYLITLISVGSILYGYRWLQQRAAARVAALTELSLTVNREGTHLLQPGDRETLDITLQQQPMVFNRIPGFLSPLFFLFGNRVLQAGETITTSGAGWTPDLGPYRSIAFPANLVADLGLLRDRLDGQSLELPIHLEQTGLGYIPWEAPLAFGLATEEASAAAAMAAYRPWRVAPAAPDNLPLAESGWRIGPIRVVSSGTWYRMAESGWQKLGTSLNTPGAPSGWAGSSSRPALPGIPGMPPDPPAERDRVILTDILEARFDQEELQALGADLGIDAVRLPAAKPAMIEALLAYLEQNDRLTELLLYVLQVRPNLNVPYKLLHLIGTPIQASAGLQWQVTGAGELEAIYAQKYVPLETAGRAGELLSADELPVQVTPLIVLQGVPTPDIGRSEAEREQAAFQRMFAEMLMTAGAHAVIVVPGMPSMVAELILNRLADVINGQPVPSRGVLLDAVAAMRQMIVAQGGGEASGLNAVESAREKDTYLEIALDVCLFAREDTNPDALLKQWREQR